MWVEVQFSYRYFPQLIWMGYDWRDDREIGSRNKSPVLNASQNRNYSYWCSDIPFLTLYGDSKWQRCLINGLIYVRLYYDETNDNDKYMIVIIMRILMIIID